jgi:molybdate transport system substrate-binding protein
MIGFAIMDGRVKATVVARVFNPWTVGPTRQSGRIMARTGGDTWFSTPHANRVFNAADSWVENPCHKTQPRKQSSRCPWILLFFCGLTLVGGCRRERGLAPSTQPSAAATEVLDIAAAADLKFALDDLAARFHEAHPGVEPKITYGSSGTFYSQLSQHAPFDLFFSADVAYPTKLIEAGLANKNSLFVYGTGKIVVWVPNDSKFDFSRRGLAALAEPGVGKVAIANPQHAPYGRAAEAALKKQQVWNALQPRLILGENIAQTAQFAQSGSVDAGIIALSLALSPAMKDKGRYWIIPPEDYPKIEQAGVIMNYAAHPASAEALREFVTGPQGREILERYGFIAPKK